MARELMPKSGIMMPYVVLNRQAGLTGVTTVDGDAGAVLLGGKYLKITDADNKFAVIGSSYDKAAADARFLPKAAPEVAYETPFRSKGATSSVPDIDLIKAGKFTDPVLKDPNDSTKPLVTENTILIGDLASGVSGVNIFSEGRAAVIWTNDGNNTEVSPLYSRRYRPEIMDMPFASIGTYVLDSKGRTIGVDKSAGINNDIKQITGLTTALSIAQGGTGATTVAGVKAVVGSNGPLTLGAAAQGPNDAVTLTQLQAASGGSGGSLNGVMNNFVGAIEWFNGTRAKLPAGYLPADGTVLQRSSYPDLWGAVNGGILNVVNESLWVDARGGNPQSTTPIFFHRSKFSSGDNSTTFRVPDLNGQQNQSTGGIFLGGPSTGKDSGIYPQAAPNITGTFKTQTYNGVTQSTGAFTNGDFGNGISGTDGTGSAVTLDASRSSAAYGRDGDWLYPTKAVGLWIIRASGAYVSANTNFNVIQSLASLPPTNSEGAGGDIISDYQVTGTSVAKATLRATKTTGNTYSSAKLLVGNVGGTPASSTFELTSAGDISIPRAVNAQSASMSGNVAIFSPNPTVNTAADEYYNTNALSTGWVSRGSQTTPSTADRGFLTIYGQEHKTAGQALGSFSANLAVVGYNSNVLWQFNQSGTLTCPNGIVAAHNDSGGGFQYGAIYTSRLSLASTSKPFSSFRHVLKENNYHCAQIHVDNDSSSGTEWELREGGSIWTGNQEFTRSGSDSRLKDNITDAKSGALDRINSITTREFDWKENGRHDRGYIAQELEKIDSTYVFTDKYADQSTAIKNVSSNALIADLISSVQTLTSRVAELEAKIKGE